jgi:hypothetical protein
LYLPKDKQPERYGIDQPVSPILFGQLVDPFLFWQKSQVPAATSGDTPQPADADAAVLVAAPEAEVVPVATQH